MCDVESRARVPPCAFGSCAAGEVCDTDSGLCGSVTCSAAEQQPAACGDGQFCDNATCAGISAEPCPLFATRPPPPWDAATSTGPITFRAVRESPDPVFCAVPDENVRIRLSVYRHSGQLPETAQQLEDGFSRTSAGNEVLLRNLLRPSSGYLRSADGRYLELLVNDCIPVSAQQVSVGFYFTGGNVLCHNSPR